MAGVALVPGLDDELVERVLARLRELEPAAVAVLVYGSYARGEAAEDSDLDLSVVTRGMPSARYRTWFEKRPGASPLHIALGGRSLEEFLAHRRAAATWRWALGFPVLVEMLVLWAEDEARALIGDSLMIVRPPAPPELEDFVELVTKVRRSYVRGDGIGIRLYAQDAAVLVPSLLRALNDERVVRSHRDAVEAALSYPVAPEHYAEDLTIALGLEPRDHTQVAEATLRLARELLAFLRERKPDVDPQPDIARYLADGTLERHLGFDAP